MDPEFFNYAVEVLEKHKYGVPGFVNDEVILPSLKKFGFTDNEAESYCFAGCFWYVVPGKEYPYHDMESVSGPRVMNLAIEEAIASGIRSFEELMDIFRAKTDEAMAAAAEALGSIDEKATETYPEMVLSLIMDGCIEKGLDVTDNGAEKSMTTMLYVGLATTADSLYAIKNIVFDRKKLTLAELWDILKNNFDQKEDLRLELLSVPKFGNGNAEIDMFCSRIANDFKEISAKYKNKKGFVFRPAFYSWHRHIGEGIRAGATADGRKAGLPVSQGVNPSHGQSVEGVTATIGSISEIGFADTAGAPTHLHFNLVPNENISETDTLKTIILTAFAKGLPHIIVNHINKDILRKAIDDPASYRDLVIRVTGYSARFVQLSREIQEEVLLRTVF
jgi:formate C-acetyltransferase